MLNSRRLRPLRRLRVRLRVVLRQLDRQTPGWMGWLTPWGASLALHALVLLLLAIILFSSNAEQKGPQVIRGDLAQLRDDLTSVDPNSVAGDPFTTLRTEEPPSLTFDPTPSKLSNTPDLDVSRILGEDLDRVGLVGAPAHVGAPLGGLGSAALVELAVTAPFSGRQGPARAELVRREGGTVESERAVERGLDWLARHQRSDGGWSLDTAQECTGQGCPPRGGLSSDTAATGLALLPMLGAGHDHLTPGRYQEVVRQGLNWLTNRQSADGDLFTGGASNAYLYSHAIATMALCEAYGITRDPELREPAERAVRFIIASQSPGDGGWRYQPGQPGDTSVLGWKVFALRSAHLAGLEIPDRTVAGIWAYLDAAAADGRGASYAYQPGRRATAVMTAEALVCRQILGWPRKLPALVLGAENVAADLIQARERNIYYWYYGTQLLHNMKGRAWTIWNRQVRDGLVRMQVVSRGCDHGSWDPHLPVRDRWGASAGRLYTTGLSVLTLEVYYRYLPLYRTSESAPIAGRGSAPEADAER